MGIKEKLDLLSLSEKERKIAEEKFLACLSLVTYEELKDIVDYLSSKNVTITKARQLKVLTNLKNDISRNFDILGEIHETAIYEQDPSKISSNVIDINKKIKFCIQNGIQYKKEDGSYEQFLFSEKAWQEKIAKETEITRETANPLMDESIVSIDPVTDIPVAEEPVVENNQTFSELVIQNPVQPETIPFSAKLDEDNNIMDLKEFQKTEEVAPMNMSFDNLTSSVERMQSELGSIESQKNTLEQEKASLKAYQDSLASQFVGFDDLDFEQYRDDNLGMGRAA